jgi:GntR family transcriptional regulator
MASARAAVDHAVATPLYLQIARLILEQTSGGELQRGARLPSERRLCAELGVSRLTLRKALATLVEEGVLESSQGRGWFVATGVLGEPPNALRSFSETARIRGLEPSARVLHSGRREATLNEAESFGVAPGSELFELRRIRCLDGIPVACDESRVPLSLAPGLVHVDFTTASLYGELERAGVLPVRAEYAVEAAEADRETAKHLGLEVGGAVLKTVQTAYAAFDRAVELSATIYRGDRYRFRASLYRPLLEIEGW